MTNTTASSKLVSFAAILIIISLSLYLLFVGRNILSPFLIAVVIWYVIIAMASSFSALSSNYFKLPHGISLSFAIIASCLIFYGIFMLASTSISHIVADAPLYQQRLTSAIKFLNTLTGLDLNPNQLLTYISVPNLFSQVALALSNVVQNLMLILLYVLFLLMESHSFRPKLERMLNNQNKYKKASFLLEKIEKDINHYIRIKTIISLFTAVASYLILISFGVKEAAFWALLIFLLNYIPTIGSIIAVGLTLIVISVQFDSLSSFITIGTLLILVQAFMGTILEPRMTGTTLNLSPIVILLSMAIWGSMWGVLGMFLCVPLITILNIILAQFDKTRPIAVLLTANGQLPEKAKT